MENPSGKIRTQGGKMTREQRRAIAAMLLCEAGNLVEFWDEKADQAGVQGITAAAAAEVIASWLKDLPGSAWDMRLPQS